MIKSFFFDLESFLVDLIVDLIVNLDESDFSFNSNLFETWIGSNNPIKRLPPQYNISAPIAISVELFSIYLFIINIY